MKNQAVVNLSGGPLGFVNVYLIQGEESILVDAGFPGHAEKIFKMILERNINPSEIALILLTHGHIDHYGGAAALREMTNAPVAIHREDASALVEGVYADSPPNGLFGEVFKRIIRLHHTVPFRPDILLEDRFSLTDYGVDGEVIHTPGHTRGSASIVLSNGAAIVGDLIIGFSSKNPRYHFLCDKEEVTSSIRKVMGFSPNIIYPGHGGPFTSEAVVKKFCKG